jgi:hypothetical protein
MYGMINQAIKSMVIESMGLETWEEIQQKAGAPGDFDKMGRYEDALTYSLVGAISELSGQKAEALLISFGRYWIQYASQTPYGEMIKMFGANLKDCIQNLDQMHHRMGVNMPGMKPPQFSTREIGPNEFLVIYRSSRMGLSPMVIGLIEGLGNYYGEEISVTRQLLPESSKPQNGFLEESHFLVRFEN